MTYEEIKRAMDEAAWMQQNAENLARRTAPFIVGRLRKLGLDAADLRDLKRELQGFNSHSGKWKP